MNLSDLGAIAEISMVPFMAFFAYLSWASGTIKWMVDLARANRWGRRIKSPDANSAPQNLME